jgi:L-ribulose-5-phosphate 3-epimerase
VAQQVGYQMTEGWSQGENATIDYFRPVATYAARFGTLMADIAALGFDTVDIWLAHLHPAWASPEHIAIAQDVLAEHNVKVASLAGWFGGTPDEFEAACKLAQTLGAPVLGGSSSLHKTDRPRLVSLLKKYGLQFGIENHPEKTPEDILAQIGDGGDGTLGTAVDTGWWGTQGFDAAQAIEALQEHIFAVHLKDVVARGEHETCRYGDGIVPIEHCVRLLQQQGYTGAYSVEHEPELFDPTDDVRAGTAMLKDWLAQ